MAKVSDPTGHRKPLTAFLVLPLMKMASGVVAEVEVDEAVVVADAAEEAVALVVVEAAGVSMTMKSLAVRFSCEVSISKQTPDLSSNNLNSSAR